MTHIVSQVALSIMRTLSIHGEDGEELVNAVCLAVRQFSLEECGLSNPQIELDALAELIKTGIKPELPKQERWIEEQDNVD